ncbi:MAG: hypothetical protein PHY16_09980 [Methylobacter sp.]|nr:hypothetical protein [Methylobacter sp.]
MRQAVLREILRVDVNRQLHISVPADLGNEFEVIVLPIQVKALNELNDDDQFMLAAYSAVIENDPEEDAVWEKYVRG